MDIVAQIAERIEKNGYTFIQTSISTESEEQAGVTYTIGLAEKGLPEVVAVGISGQAAMAAIVKVLQLHNGKVIDLNDVGDPREKSAVEVFANGYGAALIDATEFFVLPAKDRSSKNVLIEHAVEYHEFTPGFAFKRAEDLNMEQEQLRFVVLLPQDSQKRQRWQSQYEMQWIPEFGVGPSTTH